MTLLVVEPCLPQLHILHLTQLTGYLMTEVCLLLIHGLHTRGNQLWRREPTRREENGVRRGMGLAHLPMAASLFVSLLLLVEEVEEEEEEEEPKCWGQKM